MRAVTRVALAALCSGLSAAPASLWGQGQWVPPQPPCDLPAGHFKVTGGVLYLKNAAEKPNQRDQQLAQARKVLTEAIAQDHQRSEEHTSELQSRLHLVCRLLLEKKKKMKRSVSTSAQHSM